MLEKVAFVCPPGFNKLWAECMKAGIHVQTKQALRQAGEHVANGRQEPEGIVVDKIGKQDGAVCGH